MATEDATREVPSPAEPAGGNLLVVLASMPSEQQEAVLTRLATSFPPESLLIAAAEGVDAEAWRSLQFVPIPAAEPGLTLTAADFVNAAQLAQKYKSRAILVLGPESGSLEAGALRGLAAPALSAGADIAVPFYTIPRHAGQVNSAILYPLTRALFGCNIRFPLAIDLGLSIRMAERLANSAQRVASTSLRQVFLWPVNEAAVAGYSIQEIEVGHRALPQPIDADINAILAQVAGSLFAEVETRAAFWQRARRPVLARHPSHHPPEGNPPEIGSMIDGFRLAYSNLQEIWSLVLPPQTLLGLKRLSVQPPTSFQMPDALWARIVYDFALAYRLRTINRGHLLGALIPLYLAWVASHINITAGADPERHVEAVAAAFEVEKPYLVSRWRWPDRFNP